MTSGSLLLLYFSCLCICLINASEDNATQVKAVKNCNVTKSIAFLRGLSGILFSDKSDDKLDYYFSVCGFKTYGNTSMFINQTVISVGDDEISEIGSFANFSLSYKSDGYVLLFNDSVNAAKLVLGCGSLPAFHRVSNEGEEYYVFNLFHPSLCGIRESVMYTLIVVIICTSVLTIGYCLLSCLIKKCISGLTWYESIPYIDTFENINSRFKNYIVLHFHRRQTRLAEPVYVRVPSDSPEHSDSSGNNDNKKFGSLYADLTEEKQQLLASNTNEPQDDDVLLAL